MGYCHTHSLKYAPEDGCRKCIVIHGQASAGIKTPDPTPVYINSTGDSVCRQHAAIIGQFGCQECWPETPATGSHSPREPAPTPVYTIPARGVVPGMLLTPHGDTVASVSRNGHGALVFECVEGSAFEGRPDVLVDVRLPGPSPSELCCTCWKPAKEPFLVAQAQPSVHMAGCPDAPVDGLHGGMRLWPAPWRGTPWTWDGAGWAQGGCGQIGPTTLCMGMTNLAVDRFDMVLQAFYHPPRATFEARPRDPWDRRWTGNTPWETEN